MRSNVSFNHHGSGEVKAKKENGSDVLKGMAAIRAYVYRSESTVIKWIQEYDFPAAKIAGGSVWESSKELIDEWRKEMILQLKESIKNIEGKSSVRRLM